jgi:hypothetical protein
MTLDKANTFVPWVDYEAMKTLRALLQLKEKCKSVIIVIMKSHFVVFSINIKVRNL